MPQISKQKEDKIKEMILHWLFEQSPKAPFTFDIAQATARDEEFIKRLLLELELTGFVIGVKKNPQGKGYIKRTRWQLASHVYDTFKKINSNQN